MATTSTHSFAAFMLPFPMPPAPINPIGIRSFLARVSLASVFGWEKNYGIEAAVPATTVFFRKSRRLSEIGVICFSRLVNWKTVRFGQVAWDRNSQLLGALTIAHIVVTKAAELQERRNSDFNGCRPTYVTDQALRANPVFCRLFLFEETMREE